MHAPQAARTARTTAGRAHAAVAEQRDDGRQGDAAADGGVDEHAAASVTPSIFNSMSGSVGKIATIATMTTAALVTVRAVVPTPSVAASRGERPSTRASRFRSSTRIV